MNEAVYNILPVPAITLMIKILIDLKLIPRSHARLAAFLFALVFGVMYFWYGELYQKVIAVLMYAVGAVGTHQFAKAANEMIEKVLPKHQK